MPNKNQQIESLIAQAKALPQAQLSTLVEFTEFLHQRYAEVEQLAICEPLAIPRPKQENVVAAIKRLTKTYPMIDQKVVFEQTSIAMTAHVMRTDVDSVIIDKLETFFAQAHQNYSA